MIGYVMAGMGGALLIGVIMLAIWIRECWRLWRDS